ncbi:MAG: ABC transporter permease [Acidimicrobiales bacterium]
MSLTEVEAASLGLEAGDDEPGRPGRQVWVRVRHDRAALVGLVIIGVFVVAALAAPVIAPHDVSEGDLSGIRPGLVPGPTREHPLGLDQQGRDELSRLLYGARSSLVIGVVSVTLGGLVGLAVGAVAGAFGGWVDTLLMRLMDVMLAIPGLLIAVAVAALLGPSLFSVMVAIGVAGVPVVARLLRGVMLSERERDYVLAARSLGVRRRTIVVRHLVPNSVSPVLVAATLALGGAILDAAGLAFLGLGPSDPSTPEWGTMLAEGQRALQTSPQLVLLPGAAIVLTVLGFNLVGEALRGALDPKLRR